MSKKCHVSFVPWLSLCYLLASVICQGHRLKRSNIDLVFCENQNCVVFEFNVFHFFGSSVMWAFLCLCVSAYQCVCVCVNICVCVCHCNDVTIVLLGVLDSTITRVCVWVFSWRGQLAKGHGSGLSFCNHPITPRRSQKSLPRERVLLYWFISVIALWDYSGYGTGQPKRISDSVIRRRILRISWCFLLYCIVN